VETGCFERENGALDVKITHHKPMAKAAQREEPTVTSQTSEILLLDGGFELREPPFSNVHFKPCTP
jgi:hypothetical protein